MKRRTMYSLHHQVATQGLIGRLVPFMKLEVAPGDTFSGKVGMLIRMAPLKHPLLQDIYVDQYVFYVPHRLVWDGWEDFIAAGPNDDTAVEQPPSGQVIHYPLWLTQNSGDAVAYNMLPIRAYNLIFNEYFRDQDTQDPIAADFVAPASGDQCLGVAPKRHYWNELRPEIATGADARALVLGDGTAVPLHVKAEDILRALAEQKLQMRRATYGTRYVDILKSFGVSVNYQMLQRPELVASGHSVINVTDVVSTAKGTDGDELGTTSGYGVSGNRITIRRKSFPEHGTLIGVAVLRFPFVDRAMVDYMDKWRTYASYYDPGLELLPPVAIKTDDIIGPKVANPNVPVGYIPWGEWYRKATNRVHYNLSDWTGEHWAVPIGDWNTRTFNAADLYSVYPSGEWDTLFTDTTYGHYQLAAVNHLRAARMISPGTPISKAGST